MLLGKKIYHVEFTESKFEKSSFLLVPECISLYPVTGAADPNQCVFLTFRNADPKRQHAEFSSN